MPKLYLPAILLLISISAFSQQFTIKGSVIDTSENAPLENAVISILRAKDSVLIKFVRTKADGSFLISDLKNSNNIILVTFPGYADYADFINDSTNNISDLGKIPLTKKSELLETVIVQQKIAAIRMKGDTLEYKADSFGVREGAAVEELLKRLPGITVNRNGEITAQGQKVNKVLVDGEEFFSDDPAVVIKNLQADAVKEVQVFDKKSEQADFTGIDDGKRSKTINLTLKENKKKGYFIKARLAGGTTETFDNDVMLNAFRGARKIAAFGIMSNTGRQGLNWQENDQFGEGNDLQFDNESGNYFFTNGEDFSEGLNLEEGLPKAWAAGFHFSNKWDSERKKINMNYRFFKNNQRATSTTISQYILPDTQYFSTASREAFSSITRHNAKGVYDLKFDSLSSMKISVNGNIIESENASLTESPALNTDGDLINSNHRIMNSQVTKNNFAASMLWRKKFARKGRTLSINFDQQASDQQMDGFLQSTTEYTSGGVLKEDIDQKKSNGQNAMGLSGNVVYTEPLSKIFFLSVNYGYRYRKEESFRTSLDNTGSGEYTKPDTSLSNDFRFRYNIQSAGMDVKLNKKKMMVIVGSGINYAVFDQKDLLRDTAIRYSFVNYFPKVLVRLTPTPQRNFSFQYNGRTNQPTLQQLQPVKENADPLNIRIGNPSLRQEFIHSFNLFFNDYKVLKNRGIYFSSRAEFNHDAISNSINVDEGGKTTYKAINVNGNFNVNVYMGYGWKAKKLGGINLDIGLDGRYSRINTLLNNLGNTNYYRNYNIGGGVGKYKDDKFFVFVRPKIGYTFSKSSLRPDVLTRYLTSESEVNFWIKLPYKFEFYTGAYLNFREKTDVFDRNRNSIKWDANVSRKFFKKDNLELKLGLADILNQNIGFNRTANSNIITENSFATLKRYWMFSVEYKITKTP